MCDVSINVSLKEVYSAVREEDLGPVAGEASIYIHDGWRYPSGAQL